MAKTSKSTRSRIVSTAWKLFYRDGYDNTTIDDIIEDAHVSKGSFYHYFASKESLIDGISYLFDEAYEEILDNIDEALSPIDKLVTLNQEIFFMIENTVPVHLLTRIMSSQLTAKGDKHLLDPDRTYFRVIRQIVIDGKEQGVFSEAFSVNEICVSYALFERGLMYDWCVSNGNYAFSQYASKIMRVFLNGFTI
ncbi:MAG: TetR/AcrR family transcriptional regulator [Clostridiales bacterium]|nr:TetR/AcrR family transcriptional regulator [Candidatus Crickella equi]